jgi:SPX domain protein involved in polyphosphate accumulation
MGEERSQLAATTTTITSQASQSHDAATIGRSPGEVAFFKLLHAEFKKASHFFDRATEEFTIREARVREGMEIMKQPNSIMVNEKWSFLAKSIYRLYKDLLLLETFAIMTYCSFSKILKKHDKVTGYETRNAFMENIVNKANFTHYPQVLAMISRCEGLYEEVSSNLLQEGKHGLYEDERTCRPVSFPFVIHVVCTSLFYSLPILVLSNRFVYQHDFSPE